MASLRLAATCRDRTLRADQVSEQRRVLSALGADLENPVPGLGIELTELQRHDRGLGQATPHLSPIVPLGHTMSFAYA